MVAYTQESGKGELPEGQTVGKQVIYLIMNIADILGTLLSN